MSTVPDVSVIIPTFRRPRPLAEAIRSALGQEPVALEVLVVDDSPEGSAEPVAAAAGDERVRYLRHLPPSGGNPALVRNLGWASSRGRLVHFLDDDDRVATGAYQAMIAALEARPDRAAVFGRIEPFGDDPRVLQLHRRYFDDAAWRATLFHRLGSRRLMALSLLFTHAVLFTSACLIRRSAVEELGGFDARCLPMEDTDFFARLFRRHGAVYVERPVLHYRTGQPSILHDQRDNERIAAAYRQLYANYRAEHGSLELRLLQLLARTVFRWARGVAIPR